MPDREEALNEIFRAWDAVDSPGCAVGIVEDGRLVVARGYGMADLEHNVPISSSTVFHVASVAKQFTAFSVGLLALDGKLSFDHDVRKYIPELPEYGRPITLWHLIHHTSGLRDQWNLLNLAGWREHDVVTNADVLDLAVRQRELDFPPGDDYQYSNTGYTLLALIVERVTGQPLRFVAEERIFRPMGMTHTVFRDDHTMLVPNRAYAYVPKERGGYRVSIPSFDTAGATSLFSTVEDLARWPERFWNPRPGERALIDQLLEPAALNDGEHVRYGGGLAFGVHRGLKWTGHSGGDAGYRSHLMWFPEQRFAVVVLGNLGTLQPDQLAYRVAEVYLADRLAPPAVAPVAQAVSEAELAVKAGLYWSRANGKLRRLEFDGGKLSVPLWPGHAFGLVPLGGDRFAVRDEPIEFVFTKGSDGSSELRELYEGRTYARYQSVASVDLAPESLAEYAGTYRSDELAGTWEILRGNSGLVLDRPKFKGDKLQPAFADGFLVGGWDPLVFDRDDQNQIVGFTLSGFRVRHLKFQRQATICGIHESTATTIVLSQK